MPRKFKKFLLGFASNYHRTEKCSSRNEQYSNTVPMFLAVWRNYFNSGLLKMSKCFFILLNARKLFYWMDRDNYLLFIYLFFIFEGREKKLE